ncbi:MAG TPA: insulinase family protein [Candidatus Elarobacter sp.]|nr:insulinase family protein [Candidatus Elarobacter sp.]
MRSRAAIVAALLVCGTAGAGAQVPSTPAETPPAPAGSPLPPTGTLPGGVAYELRADPAQSAAAVALWYRAPSAGFDAAPTPGLARLAATTVAASTPITGTPLSGLVARYGGRLFVDGYPNSVSITALVPPDRVAATVRAMTGDYFAPVVTAAGLQAGLADSTEDALLRSVSDDAIEDALGAALFASGPLHDGSIGTREGLANAGLDRVRAFAQRAFRPSNAILVLTGNVDASVLANVATRAGTTGVESPEPGPVQSARPAPATRRIDGYSVGDGLAWIGPPIADEADATSMDFLADALFAPRTGAVPKALGELKAAVRGTFVTYHNPGIFIVTITGDDAATARPIVERTIAAATKPLAPAAFAAARAAFVYDLLSDMDSPSSVADTYGWYAVEGDPSYAPAEGGLQGRYFHLVGTLTPAGVARTAVKYLGVAPAVVVENKRAPADTRTGT